MQTTFFFLCGTLEFNALLWQAATRIEVQDIRRNQFQLEKIYSGASTSTQESAGHQRTFIDNAGIVHQIEHHVHSNHAHLAEAAGLSLIARRDGVVGPSIREFYVRGIGLKAYKRDVGLKLVAAFLFRRPDN